MRVQGYEGAPRCLPVHVAGFAAGCHGGTIAALASPAAQAPGQLSGVIHDLVVVLPPHLLNEQRLSSVLGGRKEVSDEGAVRAGCLGVIVEDLHREVESAPEGVMARRCLVREDRLQHSAEDTPAHLLALLWHTCPANAAPILAPAPERRVLDLALLAAPDEGLELPQHVLLVLQHGGVDHATQHEVEELEVRVVTIGLEAADKGVSKLCKVLAFVPPSEVLVELCVQQL
mmetsp:Transcript_76671/g.248184  ORF Transcript_76671/g.248184 Transcript_76671/m.248184 type:complete len:230 (-) Transcript_76671:1709-2398(-)